MTTPTRIPLCEPALGGNAQRYLNECLETNFVSSVGPFVERFEKHFAATVGAKHAVACASGTAALHVALQLAGVTAGDEVWVPTLTFIASANPVSYLGATCLLYDAEATTWNGDPQLLISELSRRAHAGQKLPRAIMAVHLLGHPADIEPLVDVCNEYDIALIEDAAEALGATYLSGKFAGRPVGTIGRFGCFSFNGNKIVTAGGGGMIVTDNLELARRTKHLTTQARLPGREYWHDEIGYNYRLTNLAAALGLSQLEQLHQFLQNKRTIATRYNEAFSDITSISPPPRTDWALSSAWLYSIQTGAREQLQEALEQANIEARPLWTPLHLMKPYQAAPRLGGAVAEQLWKSGLSLPCSVNLTREQQDRVIDVVKNTLK